MTSRCTARNVFALRFVGWVLLAFVVLLNVDPSAKASVDRPAPEGSARALVAAHECSDTVQNPTHAVVTVDGVTRYVGQRLTGKAIEHAVFGIDHGLTVHGFCA